MKARRKTVESALGVHTTEATARRIDKLLATLPTDKIYREIRRKSVLPADTSVEESKRCEVSYVSTRAMDKDKEIVIPEGIDLTEYRSNPVVLFDHDAAKPVGKCQWVKNDERGLIAKTSYPKRPADYVGEWLPDFVWEMIVADVLRGKSIGFLPLEVREPAAEELEAYPKVEVVFSKVLLFEYSVVAVPCNGEALVEAISKGIGLDFWKWKTVGRIANRKASSFAAKPPAPTRAATVAEELAKIAPLDAERIAQLAVKRLLDRWDV